ncbi:MAG: hypothetical protein L3K06_03045, partial [Thermoplasmata archaeon]|nr:hypothetical protein [Thermoplasmata archaeon]
MTLAKARLVPISADATPTDLDSGFEVQFNPTSMRMSMTNSIDGGNATAKQVQQYNATSSNTLSLDLVFDTADEDDGGTARSVRERTGEVAKFVVPSHASKEAPPRVSFRWGAFLFNGVMSGMTEDIDLFSADGVPLRAKVSISIKEQNADYEALESGAGAKPSPSSGDSGGGANASGVPAGSPGSSGGGPTNRTAPAIGGESAADFAVRMGLDPAAWRGVSAGLDGTLSLHAGAEIDFDANLSLSAGVGASAGIETGAGVSLEASLGLEVGTGASLGGAASAGAAAGFALSAAGGVGAAAETAQVVRTETAAAQARAAFGAPAASAQAPSGGPAPAAGGVGAASGSGTGSGAGSVATTRGAASLPSAAGAALGGGLPESSVAPGPPDQARPRL